MPTNDTTSAGSLLVERLADELARCWRAGERPVVEDYLALYPELSKRPDAVAELIYEELCLRQEFGQKEAADDILRRFPQWREQLRVLIECHDFLQPAAAISFPAAGDMLGDFHLLAELGRGAHGRVFLATQTTLADRPVVLKLAPRSGQEHLSLARLQHTHIVPLYSVEDDPPRGLRALCMPYFGGATLAQLLELLRGQPLSGRTGRHLVEALQTAQEAAALHLPVGGPACQFLGQVSYARAICWLGICLAEALQYTHERGLVHLDLKPSNVLWAADGQPMLLDLHLARAPIAAGEPGPVWLGGTLPYMAPEQRLAMASVEENRSVPVAVDGRADLYALGLVLSEVLGGAMPPPGQDTSWLRARNPQVTVGLADILNKCLADDPGDRYPDAAALVDDLRRHLADRPLRGVANRSLAERWGKWRRRRPYQRILLALALAVAAAAGLAALYIGQEVRKAWAELADAREHLERGEFGPARAAGRRGLAMAEGLPFCQGLAEELRGQLRVAERADAAQELHLLAERLRTLYGADDQRGTAQAQAAALGGHCRDLWQSRDLIVERLGTQPAPVQEQIHNDLLDLAILWTDLRVRLAGKNDAPIRRMALEVLAQAEILFGPSCVLDCEYRAHGAALGIVAAEKKAPPPPRTAWEHFAIGRSHFQSGHLEDAAAEFERAVALHPQDFWPHFFRGKCAFQRGRHEDAVLAFTACTVLAPGEAWCHYNRGLAYEALGQADRALEDYTRALQLDSGLAPAAVNRGVLHYNAQRYREALADLRLALDGGADPAVVHYNRALIHLAQGDRAAALASLREVLLCDAGHKEALLLLESLEESQ